MPTRREQLGGTQKYRYRILTADGEHVATTYDPDDAKATVATFDRLYGKGHKVEKQPMRRGQDPRY